MSKLWHKMSLEELKNEFNTDLNDGLSSSEARKRLEVYRKSQKGKEYSLFVPKKTGAFDSVLGFVKSPFAVALLALSLLTAIFGRWLLGISVFIITAVTVILGSIMSKRSAERLDAMKSYSSPMVRVKRGGKMHYTDGRNLVCGDVVMLSAGDLLPCDARIIKSFGLTVDELYLTEKGVSRRRIDKSDNSIFGDDDVEYPDASNVLLAGSAVISGVAFALVTEVGNGVYLGDRLDSGILAGKDKEPVGVQRLKPLVYKFAFAVTALFPLLIIVGLITLNGKTDFLGLALMLLSSVYLVSSDFLLFGCRELFSTRIYTLSKEGSSRRKRDASAEIRSFCALDGLSGVTDLVLIGSAGFRVGEYKIGEIFTAGGALTDLSKENDFSLRLLAKIYTYVKAVHNMGAEFSRDSNGITDALYAYVHGCGFDIKGADLVLRSLEFGSDKRSGYSFAYAETNTEFYRVGLIYDIKALNMCDHIREGSLAREITCYDIDAAQAFCDNAIAKAKSCVFVISESDNKVVLEAILTMYQPIDPHIVEAFKELKSLNVRTTLMLDEYNEQNTEILNSKELYNCTFCRYTDFDIDRCVSVIRAMRENGDKVAAFGVADEYNQVLAAADIAISCDTLRYSGNQYRESVYERLPAEGKDTDLRASQQTRLLSKVTVRRASAKGGGVSSVLNAIKASRSAYIAFSYSIVLFLLLMSNLIPFVVMTVVTGNILIDAAQTALLASAFAMLSVTAFSESKPATGTLSGNIDFSKYPLDCMLSSIPDMIARVSSAAFVAVAVKILDYVGVFGPKPSYTLPIFLCIVITAIAEVFIINMRFKKRKGGSVNCWHKVVIIYTVLLAYCALTTQYPFSSMLYPNGFGTLEFLIVPVYILIYFIGLCVVHFIKRKRE